MEWGNAVKFGLSHVRLRPPPRHRESQTAMHVFVAANFLQVTCAQLPQLPRPGEILLASGVHSEPGGKGLNVAIGCRRLGAEVHALVGIGRDAAGDGLVDLLRAHAIPERHVHRLADTSGLGMGFIGGDGENCGAVFAGPNLLLGAEHADLAQADIASSDWVYGQFETALPAVQRCFELARAAGVATMLNPSPWQTPPDALLAVTDVLLVNEVEAHRLLGKGLLTDGSLADEAAHLSDAVQALWQRWPGRLLVVTAGHRGCLAFVPGQAPLCCPAWSVDAVDTLGAGDAFASGLIAAMRGPALGDVGMLSAALQQASACGAWMASHAGVLDALPTAQALAGFMATGAPPTVTAVTAAGPLRPAS